MMATLMVGFNAQAGFWEDLGKELSMLSCKNSKKKRLIESIILNTDPSKPQIWSYKITKDGKLTQNPDPRKWFTIHARKSLRHLCWNSRLSWYVRSKNIEMYPATNTTYMCGHKVYSCMVTEGGGDSDDNNHAITPDHTDDGDQGPGDTDDGDQGPGNNDDNF